MGELYLYKEEKEYLESAEVPRGYLLALEIDFDNKNLYKMCFLEGENEIGELDKLVEELEGCRIPIAFLPEKVPKNIEKYVLSQYIHIIEKKDSKLKYLKKNDHGIFEEKEIHKRQLSEELDKFIFEASFFGMFKFNKYIHTRNDDQVHKAR